MRAFAMEGLEDRCVPATDILTDPDNVVTGLYRQLLQRNPEDVDLQSWVSEIESGASLETIASSIWDSPEFRADEVNNYYIDLLGRMPDETGLAGFTSFLLEGGSEEEVLTSILSSSEFFAKSGGNDYDFITNLYLKVLGRNGSEEEVDTWIATLDSGASYLTVVDSFVNSDEYRELNISAIYQYVLGRDAEAIDLELWSNYSTGDGWLRSVSLSIISSPENLNRTTTELAEIDLADPDVQSLYISMMTADYASFAAILDANFMDPEFVAAIENGLLDGQPVDEVTLVVLDTAFDTRQLRPTQNFIGLSNSLGFVLTNAAGPGVIANYLAGGTFAVANGTIMTGDNGDYIIDGHHRWSQLFVINPNTRILADDLPSLTDPFTGLEATKLAIVAATGSNPSSAGGVSANLLTTDYTGFFNETSAIMAGSGTTPAVLMSFGAFGIGDGTATLDNQATVINYLWSNVLLLQANNQPITGALAPPRELMPQADDTTLPQLQMGNVNYLADYFAHLGG